MIRLLGGFLVICLVMMFTACESDTKTPIKLILDTDISSDADDAGAVAFLHHAARSRPVVILAMMVSSGDPWSAGCLQVINSYFNRPGVPIGLVSGRGVIHASAYTKAVAEMGNYQEGRKEDAVALYREILSQQPDGSVTIVTIGHLTNLKGLLASRADQYSERSGRELVRQKVKSLVCMGGEYPTGKEWNFSQDVAAVQTVVESWPTPITFIGYEIGKDIVTGTSLRQTPPDNPVRLSYLLHNNLNGRPSWDQLAVLFAVLETDESPRYFSVSPPGRNTIDSTGTNVWQENANGNHRFLRLKISKEVASQLVEDLMTGGKLLPL